MKTNLTFVVGLKFFLAAWVVETHFIRPNLSHWDKNTLRLCHYSVVTFFVLAGFFSYLTLQRALKTWLTIQSVARATVNLLMTRLMPLMILLIPICGFMVASKLATWDNVKLVWTDWHYHLITCMWSLVWSPDPTARERLFDANVPLWYISPQALLWLMSPAIYLLMRPLVTVLPALYWFILICVFDWVVLYLYILPSGPTVPGDLILAVYFSPLTYAPKHLAGMFLGAAIDQVPSQFSWGLVADLSTLLWFLHYAYYPLNAKLWKDPSGVPESWFGVTLFAGLLILAGCKNGNSIVIKFLSSRWLTKVSGGNMSLLVFVLHVPLCQLLTGRVKYTAKGYEIWLPILWLACIHLDHIFFTPLTTFIRTKCVLTNK